MRKETPEITICEEIDKLSSIERVKRLEKQALKTKMNKKNAYGKPP